MMKVIPIFLLFLLLGTSAFAKQPEDYPSLMTVFEYPDNIEELANKGDKNAMWMLGMSKLPVSKRNHVASIFNFKNQMPTSTEDEKSALKLIKKAADGGNPIAMVMLGRYNTRCLPKPDYKTAIKWYEKAVGKGYGDACPYLYEAEILGQNYGKILYDNKQKSLAKLKRGIDLKSPYSAFYFGSLCFLGGVPTDYLKAVEYFEMMEEWGYYSHILTYMYFQGAGVEKNYREGLQRMEEHQDSYHTPQCYYEAAECLLNGKGVKPNYHKANLYYLKTYPYLFTDSIKNILNSHDVNKIEDIEYEEDKVTTLSNGLRLQKTGGIYFIVDNNNRHLTHALDTVFDMTDSVVVKFNDFSTAIDKDGNMSRPIVYQILSEVIGENEISLVRRAKLCNLIYALDADGSMHAASILHNNIGADKEGHFTPISDYKYKNGKGINKKIGKDIQDALNKGFQNYHFSQALPFYERALELNPDFELAEMNAKRLRNSLTKKPSDSPFMLGVNSVLTLANQFSQISKGGSGGVLTSPTSLAEKPQKASKKDTPKKGQKVASTLNEQFSRDTYNDYISQLIKMKTWPEKYYNNENRKYIQNNMRKIRHKHNFPKSEWEDWGGM